MGESDPVGSLSGIVPVTDSTGERLGSQKVPKRGYRKSHNLSRPCLLRKGRGKTEKEQYWIEWEKGQWLPQGTKKGVPFGRKRPTS